MIELVICYLRFSVNLNSSSMSDAAGTDELRFIIHVKAKW